MKDTNFQAEHSEVKSLWFWLWRGRIIWPITGINVEHDHFPTLGITFSCIYDLELDITWTQIFKLKNRIPLIRDHFIHDIPKE